MSNEDLVILNFNKTITSPTSTIVFESDEPEIEIKYIDLDIISEQIIADAKLGNVACQELLKQLVIDKFVRGELNALLDLNAVPI